jgi:PTH1 family peptidyl-tRNA hydrolase
MKDCITIIVGLGNPGPEYSLSRHNMGFGVIEYLSEKYGIKVGRIGFKGRYGRGEIEGKPVVLIKPSTYMNNSGESVMAAMKWYGAKPDQLIVIYDDMDLEPGAVRIRPKGSAGSHNGMKSVIYHLRTDEFTRIRVGIGRPDEKIPVIDYVLQRITEPVIQELKVGMATAGEAVATIVKYDVASAMNIYNSKKKE